LEQDNDELKAIITKAAKEGAGEALKQVGINSPKEAQRFREIMYFSGNFMDACLDTKRVARRSAIRLIVLVICTLVIWGIISLVTGLKSGTIHHISIF